MHFLQKYVTEHFGWQPSEFKQAYLELQTGYRSRQRIGYADIAQIQSYVFTRFPATYSVCLKIFENYFDDLPITSILDWGCGIGTASLALSQLKKLECSLVEQDNQAKAYAEQFLKHFFPDNTLLSTPPDKVDIAVFSYSLGEVKTWQTILDEIWPKTNYLLIVEPGTPTHFNGLLQMREYLLSKGAYILGPCCHQKICPLGKNDWCHFSANVQRSKEHRMLKNAERSFEQEAYSYVLFTKNPKILDSGRIISPPRIHSGHIDVKICSNSGEIIKKTVGRSSKIYKQLKKSQWGESINVIPPAE